MLSETKTLRQSYKASMLAVVLAFCLIAATMLTTTALRPGLAYGEDGTFTSAAATPDYTSYKIEVDSNGTQEVILTFTYPGAVSFNEEQPPSVHITIFGVTQNVDVSSYEDDLIFTVLPSPGYTSISNGILTFECDMEGVTYGGTAAIPIASDQSDPNKIYFPKTVIPIGVELTSSNQGMPSVTLDVTGLPLTNGMIHVGIYYEDESTGNRIPVWLNTGSNTDPIQVYTYTAFVDSYAPNNLDAAWVAQAIARYVGNDSNFDSSRYSITPTVIDADDASITIEDSLGEQYLYVYIFDDNLLQSLNTDYPSVIAAGGVLPPAPSIA
jgi:hypothetical protein